MTGSIEGPPAGTPRACLALPAISAGPGHGFAQADPAGPARRQPSQVKDSRIMPTSVTRRASSAWARSPSWRAAERQTPTTATTL
jgi:hypothetical protein